MNATVRNVYEETLKTVCDATGVTDADMAACNREECVDARAVLVNALALRGMTDSETATLTGLTRQAVNKLKNGFGQRMRKWSVKVVWLELKGWIEGCRKDSNELATK